MNILNIQIEQIKETISHSLVLHQNELNNAIKKQLDETLGEDWVLKEIKRNVEIAIKKAIEESSNNYRVQSAISDVLSEHIAKALKGEAK